MSRGYAVHWTEQAIRDSEEIVAFVAADSVGEAERLVERLVESARRLERLPQRGRLIPELARFGNRSRREILVKPYRMIYRVEGARVYVLAVLDARRDLEDVLLERLLREKDPG